MNQPEKIEPVKEEEAPVNEISEFNLKEADIIQDDPVDLEEDNFPAVSLD